MPQIIPENTKAADFSLSLILRESFNDCRKMLRSTLVWSWPIIVFNLLIIYFCYDELREIMRVTTTSLLEEGSFSGLEAFVVDYIETQSISSLFVMLLVYFGTTILTTIVVQLYVLEKKLLGQQSGSFFTTYLRPVYFKLIKYYFLFIGLYFGISIVLELVQTVCLSVFALSGFFAVSLVNLLQDAMDLLVIPSLVSVFFVCVNPLIVLGNETPFASSRKLIRGRKAQIFLLYFFFCFIFSALDLVTLVLFNSQGFYSFILIFTPLKYLMVIAFLIFETVLGANIYLRIRNN